MTQQNIENDQIKGYYKQKDAFIRDIKTALSEKWKGTIPANKFFVANNLRVNITQEKKDTHLEIKNSEKKITLCMQFKSANFQSLKIIKQVTVSNIDLTEDEVLDTLKRLKKSLSDDAEPLYRNMRTVSPKSTSDVSTYTLVLD